MTPQRLQTFRHFLVSVLGQTMLVFLGRYSGFVLLEILGFTLGMVETSSVLITSFVSRVRFRATRRPYFKSSDPSV
jgi:hypothetical protein